MLGHEHDINLNKKEPTNLILAVGMSDCSDSSRGLLMMQLICI
jgi:hypothetical protein